MRSIRSFVLSLAFAGAFAGSSFGQSLPPDLDRFIESVRSDWEIVGLSVAVVQDGQLAYAKGFGEREIGGGAPVDENTLFAIGSNTKAFTAAGIGILVDEEKMGWDDRVTDHLPWFELYDPYVTREITVRDLLSHRSGLGRRGDANWYATDFDRKEIVRRIRFLEPETSFRAQAGYQNTMFLAAGLVLEAVSGKSWDEWITERILRPIGMTRTRTSVRELAGVDDVATPHERDEIEGTIRAVAHRNIDNIAPAGAILSSASDMSRWLLLMLGRGEIEGKRILSEATVDEVWSPNIIYGLPPEYRAIFPSMHFSTYGLGWGLRDYHGRLVATHTGGIDGMLSQVLVVPEEKLGIVVLTNTSPAGSPAENVITFHILDALLGGSTKTDWNARWKETWRKQEAAQKEQEKKLEASRVAGTSPSVALDAYASDYENDMYGIVRVSVEDGKLVIRRHRAWVGDLEHWNYDTFRVHWRDPVMGKTFVTFRLSTDGKPTVLEVEELGEFHRVEREGSESR